MSGLCDFVEASIASTSDLSSHLPASVLALDGMSSVKGRCLLNNLCRRAGTRYLEVGVWVGSTLISALFGNSESVVAADAIDNFSQFGGPRDVFEQKTREFLGEGRFTLHVDGYREVAPALQPPVNVYFYDGEHSAENQRDGLLHFWPCLADEFVFLGDDWNWPCVRQGTYEGKGCRSCGTKWEANTDRTSITSRRVNPAAGRMWLRAGNGSGRWSCI